DHRDGKVVARVVAAEPADEDVGREDIRQGHATSLPPAIRRRRGCCYTFARAGRRRVAAAGECRVTASKLQPTLLGGLFIGVLSALPVVSMGNCLCCLWVVSGGVLAAYLLQQNQDAPIQAGDAAIVGLLAGIVGAFVAAIVSIPIQMLMGP